MVRAFRLYFGLIPVGMNNVYINIYILGEYHKVYVNFILNLLDIVIVDITYLRLENPNIHFEPVGDSLS